MTRILSFWTHGKATRGQTPLVGVISLIGLYVNACVFGFVFGFLVTQRKVTWGQSPLAGVPALIGLCVHAVFLDFCLDF